MDRTKCGEPIAGDRYENAVAISERRGWPAHRDYVHFECVDDPAHLRTDQFQKWAAHEIQQIKGAASAQVHNHNDLVDALEERTRVPGSPTSRS